MNAHALKRRGILAVACLLLALVMLGQADFSRAFAQEATDSYADIALGSKGEVVRDLQTRLKELGYYTKSIDGDYGNGTKTAVASFQSRNSLNSDGIASAETVSAIYSDSAVPAPKQPNISITAVYMSGGSASVTVKNNLDVTVDSISLKLLTYDAGGNIYVASAISEYNNGLLSYYLLANETVKPGGTATYWLDIAEDVDYSTKYIGFYICTYHTTDGKEYAYNPKQVYINKNDGSVVYPTDDSEPDCMTDAQLAMANTIKFGVNDLPITPWLTTAYLLHEGEYITSVSEGGPIDLAGIKSGDIIMAFDDIDVLSGHSWEHAKLKMLDGDIVTIRYWRNNKEYTTQVAMDMDSIGQGDAAGAEPAGESESIADQLASLASMYKEGLLTKEEFDAAKAAILK